MSSWVNFAEVKARVSLEQVLRSYRVDWLRRNRPDQYRGRCPVHGGLGRDAFHANVKQNVFHCFACGAGGNVLDFVAAMEECSVREAALRLQRRYGSASAGAYRKPASSSREEAKLVTKKRKVNPPLSFSLRVDGAHTYLAQRGIEHATASYFGVGFYAGPGLMSGRIAIPIHDDQGRLVAYCGRAVGSGSPRYRFPAGFQKSQVLFNYYRAVKGDRGIGPMGTPQPVIMVEGFFDCMHVHQAGFPCVVGLMGAAFSDAQRELVMRTFSRAVLLLDGDETGRAATVRIAAALRRACPVTELDPGPGRQPDQLSADQIRQILTTEEGGRRSATN